MFPKDSWWIFMNIFINFCISKNICSGILRSKILDFLRNGRQINGWQKQSPWLSLKQKIIKIDVLCQILGKYLKIFAFKDVKVPAKIYPWKIYFYASKDSWEKSWKKDTFTGSWGKESYEILVNLALRKKMLKNHCLQILYRKILNTPV